MTKSKTVKFSIHLIKDSPKASIERKKGYFPAAIPADLRVNFYRNRDIDPSVPILSSSRCPRWKGCAAQLSYFPPNNPLLVFSPLTPFSRPNNPSNAARGTTEGSIFISVLYETLSLSPSESRHSHLWQRVHRFDGKPSSAPPAILVFPDHISRLRELRGHDSYSSVKSEKIGPFFSTILSKQFERRGSSLGVYDDGVGKWSRFIMAMEEGVFW